MPAVPGRGGRWLAVLALARLHDALARPGGGERPAVPRQDGLVQVEVVRWLRGSLRSLDAVVALR